MIVGKCYHYYSAIMLAGKFNSYDSSKCNSIVIHAIFLFLKSYGSDNVKAPREHLGHGTISLTTKKTYNRGNKEYQQTKKF
jgi:hypothetical protein